MHGSRPVLTFLVVVVAAALAFPTAAPAQELPPIMPASQVQAGMKGYGVATLKGTELTRFDVEVLGVVTGWYPKGDMILIRFSGPIVDEAGIIAGMSGSPVFIQDKLIGAVAYGWFFSKIPLAGVTPAEEMLKVQRMDQEGAEEDSEQARAEAARAMREEAEELARLLTEGRDAPLPADRLDEALMRASLPPVLRARRTAARTLRWPLGDGEVAELAPLPVPLSISGAGADAAGLLAGLSGTGLMPVQAAGGDAAETGGSPEAVPGAVVGSAFITGDMEIASMGTATWVDGDRVVAFGHPLLSAGRVDLPMVLGRDAIVVPSIRRSFRISNPDRIVGRVVEDRDSCIVGRLGEEAPMFPCTVRVKGLAGDTYNYDVAGYWQTAPMFASLAVAYSSTRWQGEGQRYTLEVTSKLHLKGREEPVVLRNEFATESVMMPVFEMVELPLSALTLNPFRRADIAGVDYEVEARKGFDAALIRSVRAERLQAEPGSEVSLIIRLQQWRGEEVTRKVTLPIPETARPGTSAEVLVCDAVTNQIIKARLDPGFFAPKSFEQLIELLEEMESNRHLVVRSAFVQQGVRYAGEPMPALPQSALNILRFAGSGSAEPLVSDQVQTVQTPWILQGAHTVRIGIVEPEPHKP
ncbi:MAG: SpoIVB peptidase S55 domain-containing protein [Candidatus Brocadiia bacterium]